MFNILQWRLFIYFWHSAKLVFHCFFASPISAKMRFTLSGTSPLNSTYTNESGKAIYKVSTPRVLMGHTTTVSRILPPELLGGDGFEERFGHLATIKYLVGRSIINYGGEEIKTGDHFKKVGTLWRYVTVSTQLPYSVNEYDGSGIKRVLDPTGRPINGAFVEIGVVRLVPRFTLSTVVNELDTRQFVRDDGEEAILAKFLDKTLGIIGPASAASLEIFPAGEDIMDYIFVTFLYVEKVRRDRKKG